MKKCIEKQWHKKQGRPDISERPRFAALLAHSFSPLPVPTGGLIFPLNHRPLQALDEFQDVIRNCGRLCKWNHTPPNAFSKAVAPLQQCLPVLMVEPKNRICQKH
jgi:hypothetical protein